MTVAPQNRIAFGKEQTVAARRGVRAVFAAWAPAELRKRWAGLQGSTKLALVAYSLVGAFCALLGARVVRTEWFYHGNYQQNYFPGLQPVDALLFVALFIGVLVLTCAVLALYKYLLARIPLRRQAVSPHAVFFISWVVIFVCWLPYFLVNFPGVIMADSIVTIKQALGINPLTTHHPLAYTGFIALCLHIGNAIWGSNVAGLAVYTLVQMLFISGVFGYALSWLARRGIPVPALVVMCALLALSSVFSLHAVSMWKDGIYASFMLLLVLRIFDAVANPALLARPTFLLRLVLLGLAVCLARTNGVYAMVVVWLGLLVAAKPYTGFVRTGAHGRQQASTPIRGKVALAACASLATFAFIVGTATALLGAKSEPVERYGIPLQQVAAVVVYQGEIAPEQREFLDAMLPLEDYKEEYLPCSVDGIKWADNFDKEFFNTHQQEFLQVWLALGAANPKIYADAYIMESYEYWTFGDVYRNLHVNYVNDKYDAPDLGIEETNLLEEWFGEGVANLFPFRFVTLGEGAVSWLVLFAGLLLFVAKRERWAAGAFARVWWLVLLPAVASWLTVLVSSPFAALPRYVLPSIFLLPFLALFPWAIMGQDE